MSYHVLRFIETRTRVGVSINYVYVECARDNSVHLVFRAFKYN